jgi:hypothetical protein
MRSSCAYGADGRYACDASVEAFFAAPFMSPHLVQQRALTEAVGATTQAAFQAQVSDFTIGQAQVASQAAQAQIGQQAAQWSTLMAQQASVLAQAQAQNAAQAQQLAAQAAQQSSALAQAQAAARAQAQAQLQQASRQAW